MPRVRIQVWGAVVDVLCGMKDGIMEGLTSVPNTPTPMPTLRPTPDVPDMKQQVINICKGGALTYTSKEYITKLFVEATPNLLV